MTKTDSTATLTDRDLDEIEAQMDDTVPVYVPTLIDELRRARRNEGYMRRAVEALRDSSKFYADYKGAAR